MKYTNVSNSYYVLHILCITRLQNLRGRISYCVPQDIKVCYKIVMRYGMDLNIHYIRTQIFERII